MPDKKPPVSFTQWLPGFLLRFVLWNGGIISLVRGYSWLLAYDDEFKVWAAAHRGELIIILFLGSVMYGMMDWMRSNEP